MRADLHMHSNNSDGSDSVERIIDRAIGKGLEIMSITDHDNANGQARANEYAKDKILYINGIELSAYNKMEIHILGYGYDYKSDILNSKTSELLNQRETRIKKILSLLREHGMNIDDDEIDFRFAGRLQVALVMVKKKFVTCTQEAFAKYLGTDGSCYIPSNRLSPEDAVKTIKAAGGTPVIAHPEKYLNSGILEDMIVELKRYGLKGLECHYSSHTVETTNRLVRIASKYNLIETVGSDYHGTNGINDIAKVKYDMPKQDLEILMGHPF